MSEIDAYLEEVRAHLHLDSHTERRVISELTAHFQEKQSDLRRNGMAEEAAAREAISAFGEPRMIARLMYEAFSRGSWTDTLIGCQPHLVVAALFATHLWRNPLLLFAAFLPITLITLLAWRKSAPAWLYPWTGYALLPFLIVAYFAVDPLVRTVLFLVTGDGAPAPVLHLAGLGAFCIFALWLVVTATVRVARRDWILVSLMLSPLPVVVIWLASVSQSGEFVPVLLRGLEAGFYRFDGAMALFCITLGACTALFMRLRQRYLKATAILATGMIGGALAVSSIQGGVDLFRLLVISLCFLLFLVFPFVLHSYLGREGRPKQA
jgi:hypothetical protein